MADEEGHVRHPLEVAREIAFEVVRRLQPYVARAEIAGSIRRQKPEVKDIEVVAEPRAGASDLFGNATGAASDVRDLVAMWGHVTKGGGKYLQVEDVLGSGITLDLFLVTPPASWGAIMAIRTGPSYFSTMLVSELRGRVMKCEEGRVLRSTGHGWEEVPTPTERDFFEACGVDYLQPWDRK